MTSTFTINNLSPRVLLVILDGYGKRANNLNNAVENAHTPHLNDIFDNYPSTLIEAGGVSVGLPKGVSGNSEVGHLNIGAGRSIRQDLVRINEHVKNKTLETLPELDNLINKAKEGTKRIHLMGLLSDGGVHSHIDHIKEFIRILGAHSDLHIFFHAFMDGRDTPIKNGIGYIEDLLKMPNFTLASVGGRSIGMDRDRRWEKIQHAYQMMIGQGDINNLDPISYMKDQYQKNITDEFITPTLFSKDFALQDGDCVFFCNFRPDRARQITLAMMKPNFSQFNIPIKPGHFLCLSPYVEEEVELPILISKEKVTGGLSEIISEKKWKQFKIAETEKYAHVTYFFNGGRTQPYTGEDQCLVPSNKEVKTYDEDPQMRAPEVTTKLVEALGNKDYHFLMVNYANSDMVGHTGNYQAAIQALEEVDKCIGELKKTCEKNDVTMIITADHGNSDQMNYEDGSPHTSHTGSPVPFSLFHPKLKNVNIKKQEECALKDIAPTVLTILGEPTPSYFTGKSIFS